MTRRSLSLSILAAAAVGCLLISAIAARAGARQAPLPHGCSIVSATTPAIQAPGRYCLDDDIFRPEGLRIASDDVVLDFAGHCLRGSRARGEHRVGVLVEGVRHRVTIRNGCIDGFMFGVLANSAGRSTSISVDSMRISGSSFRGIMIAADSVSITRNVVSRIGGTTVYGDAFAMGIEVYGRECTVDGNVVSNVYPVDSGEGVGISISRHDADCRVQRNVVRNDAIPPSGRTFGIWAPAHMPIAGNVLGNHTFNLATQSRDELKANVSLAEACQGEAASLANENTDTIFAGAGEACSELLETALRRVSPDDRNSLFRVAGIHHMAERWAEALPYYYAAGQLGSTEAARQLSRLLEVGLVTAADVEAAPARARELGLLR